MAMADEVYGRCKHGRPLATCFLCKNESSPVNFADLVARCETVMDEGGICSYCKKPIKGAIASASPDGRQWCSDCFDDLRLPDDPSGADREAENQTELPSEYYHRVFLGGDCLGATWEQLAFFQIMRKFEESVTTTEPTRPSELSQPGVAPGGGCCNRGDENG